MLLTLVIPQNPSTDISEEPVDLGGLNGDPIFGFAPGHLAGQDKHETIPRVGAVKDRP